VRFLLHSDATEGNISHSAATLMGLKSRNGTSVRSIADVLFSSKPKLIPTLRLHP